MTDDLHPARGPVSSTWSSVDPDEIDHFLTQAYGTPISLTGGQESYHLRHDRAAVPSMSVDTVRMTGATADIDPPGQLMLLVVDTGLVTRDTDGRSEHFGPGDAFVLANPRSSYRCAWSGPPIGVRTVVLDNDLLASVTGTDTERVTGMTIGDPVYPVAAQRFHRGLAYATHSVLTGPAARSATPLLVDAVARTLAAVTLSTFSNDLVPAARPPDRPDAHPATLRRAVAFIESSAHQPIGLTDIAQAACVTPRAVQLAFRRHLDCTPMQYLRRARLAAAHDELTAAIPDDGTTVAAVATRWGWDPPRFSQAYRATYGVPPSTTLQR
ncbi:helix-turn-helix transcriptional regulator [Klenkia sp. LSe6-5]|uniref:Helix-turn-helix transcriptional regulator n=1 Tax=Klenkia sesuvii TaxID=3103137 RepID=A0ABU8DTL7_9ACTN